MASLQPIPQRSQGGQNINTAVPEKTLILGREGRFDQEWWNLSQRQDPARAVSSGQQAPQRSALLICQDHSGWHGLIQCVRPWDQPWQAKPTGQEKQSRRPGPPPQALPTGLG